MANTGNRPPAPCRWRMGNPERRTPPPGPRQRIAGCCRKQPLAAGKRTQRRFAQPASGSHGLAGATSHRRRIRRMGRCARQRPHPDQGSDPQSARLFGQHGSGSGAPQHAGTAPGRLAGFGAAPAPAARATGRFLARLPTTLASTGAATRFGRFGARLPSHPATLSARGRSHHATAPAGSRPAFASRHRRHAGTGHGRRRFAGCHTALPPSRRTRARRSRTVGGWACGLHTAPHCQGGFRRRTFAHRLGHCRHQQPAGASSHPCF